MLMAIHHREESYYSSYYCCVILSASGARATMNTSELQKGGRADPLSPILDPNIVSGQAYFQAAVNIAY